MERHDREERGDEGAPKRLPRLSVVLAAGNEERDVERALRSLHALDDPDHELVLVYDRSDDVTGEIADRMGAGDDRPKVTHLRELSPGWFGKNHACWRGASDARGKLLVFADGEVVFGCAAPRRSPRVRGAPDTPTGTVPRRPLALVVLGRRDSRHCSHIRVALRVDASTPAHRGPGGVRMKGRVAAERDSGSSDARGEPPDSRRPFFPGARKST